MMNEAHGGEMHCVVQRLFTFCHLMMKKTKLQHQLSLVQHRALLPHPLHYRARYISCLIQLFINTFSARHKISRVPGSPFLGTNSHSYFILCAVYWLGGCFQSGNEWVKMNPLTYMFNLLLCCIHTYICTLHTYMNL